MEVAKHVGGPGDAIPTLETPRGQSSRQLEGRFEARRLDGPDAVASQLTSPCRSKPIEASQPGEQTLSERERVGAWTAGSKQEGYELGIRQGRRPQLVESLSRPVAKETTSRARDPGHGTGFHGKPPGPGNRSVARSGPGSSPAGERLLRTTGNALSARLASDRPARNREQRRAPPRTGSRRAREPPCCAGPGWDGKAPAVARSFAAQRDTP